MKTRVFVVIILSAALGACATTVKQAEVKQAIEISDPAKVKPIAITKVAAKIRRGTVVGTLGVGAFCIGSDEVKWRSGNKVYLSNEEELNDYSDQNLFSK